MKYNREAGTVSVDCNPIGTDRVRIKIEDTGAGLQASQIDQLFQPFNRLGQERGPEEGTGIGPVLTKRLVELMGGEIGVTSTAGSGSVFWVELKRATAAQFAAGSRVCRSDGQPVLRPGAPSRAILYVEDNPANLKLVEEMFTFRPDLRLLTATDGR